MMLVAATIIQNEEGPLLKACVEALLPHVDKWLFIDGGSKDGTLEILDSFKSDKITIIHKPYPKHDRGADGKQRNAYLAQIPDGAWVLVIDADEIISDNAYLLREHIREMETLWASGKPALPVWDVHMIHYFWHLGLVDATMPQHFVPRRLFKKMPSMKYDEVEHPVLRGFPGDNEGLVGRYDRITLHHLSNARGMERLVEKVRVQYAKSNMHTKEQLDNWIESRLLGNYPVAPADYERWPLPDSIRKWLP